MYDENVNNKLYNPIEHPNINKRYLFVKRIIDVSGSIMGLIILAPLFFIITILIKIDDPKGSIFFKQSRVGLNEKEFNMYKFRSMVSNAEELLQEIIEENETSGALFKMKEDPRVTKIGRFIRKTSIDELPQLWNVLKGDMSLVGPRPPLPREVMIYEEYHRQRLKVTPGCTGLWQISGRSKIGFEDMVKLDLKYISERSTIKDITIITKTFSSLFGSDDAY